MLRVLGLMLCAVSMQAIAEPRPFDVDDLVRLNRISDVQLRPDGKALVYALRETDWEANKASQGIWQLGLEGSSSRPRRLTASGASSLHPRYSTDGQRIYFLSARGGSMQVWMLDGPGEARVVTKLPLDVGDFALSPDSRALAFSADVYPECGADFDCSKQRADADAGEKQSGTLQDKLFVRHWDSWKTGTRAQLFLVDLDADGVASGTPRWLTRGIDGDVPTKPFGDFADIAFSPDGKDLAFVARIAGTSESWSTNSDVYRVAANGSGAPINLTAAFAGYDTTPVWSATGERLFWRSMERAGYEADRNRIMELDLSSGASREVAPSWDRSPDGLLLAADGRSLYALADDIGNHRLFRVDIKSGAVSALSQAGNVSSFAPGANRIYALLDDLDSPADLYSLPLAGGRATQLTQVNEARLKDVQFGAYEQFSFKGANDDTVHGFVVKPVGFDPGKRYPIAFIVHGGPQGSMGNLFHYRWNPQTHAGKGYAAVFIDFHGSTGYGQAFTDAIRGDWGGKPLIDLQRGMAAALEKYSFLDGSRACAMGGSYGGYMMNWIAGSWPNGFKCIISHAGIFDNRFMSYTTEELWFDEWEFEGTHFEKPDNFEKHNPINLVSKWQTPMLVIHGMLDFRVPFEQGLAVFTALQRRGIPSQILWFPDENHWILKPHNSVQWHRAVESWMQRWTGAQAKK